MKQEIKLSRKGRNWQTRENECEKTGNEVKEEDGMEGKQGRRNVKIEKKHKRENKIKEVRLQKTITKGKHRKTKGEESQMIM